jgi:hypothetical protein
MPSVRYSKYGQGGDWEAVKKSGIGSSFTKELIFSHFLVTFPLFFFFFFQM